MEMTSQILVARHPATFDKSLTSSRRVRDFYQ
jgi:hypothetical protein